MTSSMESGDIAERLTTSFMTIAPSWGAVKLARLPRNLPVGVRTAPTITGVCSDMVKFSFGTITWALHLHRCRCASEDLLFHCTLRVGERSNHGFVGSVPIGKRAGAIFSRLYSFSFYGRIGLGVASVGLRWRRPLRPSRTL